jgi:hypothetical protein
MDMWPVVAHDPLLAVVAAVLKEPSALKAWRSTDIFHPRHNAVPLTAERMWRSLLSVVIAMDGCPNRAEVDQLSGLERYTGVVGACVCMGVVEKHTQTGDENPWSLGKPLRPYQRGSSHENISKMLEISSCCSATWNVVRSGEDLAQVAEAIRAVMVALSNQCPHIFPDNGADAATLRAFVIRKILMARILHSEQVPFHKHWAEISRSQLSKMMSDESNCLSVFPEHWTAQMIG